ncbi:MAG: acyl-CoA dehydrogenase family protein [Myxococcota bacterium]|jgi:alkylation response protein AidB-like acyl-CoA dehydrogenase|nr:acyl-CoA dehydrogenase family protein [Myxococcota bacterium]
MNFDLCEEQEMLQSTVRQFAATECPLPRAREIFDAKDGHDPELWRGLCDLGLGGIQIEEAYGGAGLELLDLALVGEVLGESAFPGPFFGHALAALAIGLGGSEEQKRRWLPDLASGSAIGTIAFAEGDQMWQPEQWGLEASEGGTRIEGHKCFVPHAGTADIVVVGLAGGGMSVVERDCAALDIKESAALDRTRRVAEVEFTGAPAHPLPEGVAASGRVRDAGLVLLAADAMGAAWRCVELSVEYANRREQFGTTIGHFQALKHQLADMAIEVEPARGLYWYAAHAFDHVPDESARFAAMAKAHLTDRAMQVARDAVEAHGGIGFTWEGDLHLYFKRAMFDRAFLGSPEFHRARAAELGGW